MNAPTGVDPGGLAVTEVHFDEIDYGDCLELLRFGELGRVAVVIDGFPLIVPVNYRLVEGPGGVWIALRTRPGNFVDRDRAPVAFEVDHVDRAKREGWSVLVRGTLQRVDPEAADFRLRFDPEPWVPDARDRWLVIEPFSVTGRRLHTDATGGAGSTTLFYD
jgi:uncharacterized protein